MRLLKGEHDEKGIWYFTGIQPAANYFGCTYTAVNSQLHGLSKRTKGWKVEWVDDDNIINKFIIG